MKHFHRKRKHTFCTLGCTVSCIITFCGSVFYREKKYPRFCFVGCILIVQLNDRHTYYKEVITLRSMTMTGIRKNQQNLKRTHITFNILFLSLKVIFHLQISLSSHMHILRALNFFFVAVLTCQTIRFLTPHTF